MSLNTAEKAGRLRRARGISGYIPTDRITGHIHTLQKAGWTNVEIADFAGVDRRTVHNILHNYVATVHRPTAAAILRLRPEDVPNRVPALGSMRRVQALAVMGWPVSHTGAAAGIRGTLVNELVAGRRKRVPLREAQEIARVFRERCMTPGPSKKARTCALRNGWASPLAWDDIDNPDERPLGVAA
jgi:transcriptional regulator with XRE-family HTH domain